VIDLKIGKRSAIAFAKKFIILTRFLSPQSKLVYIFLSNRVYDTRNNNLLGRMNIRGKIQDAIYNALKSDEAYNKAVQASKETGEKISSTK
jgi:hypothetical protein